MGLLGGFVNIHMHPNYNHECYISVGMDPTWKKRFIKSHHKIAGWENKKTDLLFQDQDMYSISLKSERLEVKTVLCQMGYF